jgi:transposase
MLKQGLKPAAVARALQVSRASVSRWRTALRSGGPKALSAKPVPGRPPKLDTAQRRRIARWLLQGPIRHGYETQLWTLDRVSAVIERQLGVSYHPGHVWRILLSLGHRPVAASRLAAHKKKPPRQGRSCCFWMKRA